MVRFKFYLASHPYNDQYNYPTASGKRPGRTFAVAGRPAIEPHPTSFRAFRYTGANGTPLFTGAQCINDPL